jgi:hypothetical protein
MSKPIALIGTIGQTTKITDATTLQAMEMAAMGRICERFGYEARACQAPPSPRARRSEPNGLKLWNQEEPVSLVWIHQQTPNFMGGPRDVHCDHMEILAKGLKTADKCLRLVLDNNTTMRHKSIFGLRRHEACPGFLEAAEEIERTSNEGKWSQIGYKECADPDVSIPFIECGISAEQLILTKEIYGTDEEKAVDFCYIGTNRANKKKQAARLASLGDFLEHELAHYSGSLFGKKCGFTKGWGLMREARAHLIVRDPGMDQTPLHRYLQALMHDSIPIVLNEPAPVAFIHSKVLQDALRVSSLDEGLDLVARRDELLPLLREERDHWLKFDLERCKGL